ncbi:1-phosphatidylinositol-3-phosphate 5-kinase, partial [Blyttiomyces sp. JEL0837]
MNLATKPLPESPFPISPPLPPPRENLCSRSLHHLKHLIKQCLSEVYLDKGPWCDVLLDIATDIPFVVEIVSARRRMGVIDMGRSYHGISIATLKEGRPEESHYIPGPSPLNGKELPPVPGDVTLNHHETDPRLNELGGTVILNGVIPRDQRALERIMDFLVFSVCSLKLETHVFRDHFAPRPDAYIGSGTGIMSGFGWGKKAITPNSNINGGKLVPMDRRIDTSSLSLSSSRSASGSSARLPKLGGSAIVSTPRSSLDSNRPLNAETKSVNELNTATGSSSSGIFKSPLASAIMSWIRGSGGGTGGDESNANGDGGIEGSGTTSEDSAPRAVVDGSNRFDRAIKQIEGTLISTSPDVVFPPPHLLLRLRDEESKEKEERMEMTAAMERREKERVSRSEARGRDAAVAAGLLVGGVNGPHANSVTNSNGSLIASSPSASSLSSSPGYHRRTASYTYGSSQGTKISVDTKAGLGYYMTNNNSLSGIIRHQSITFSYSFFWTPKSAIPCQPPKILTVEYYQRSGKYQDRTLGQYIELLCSSASTACPEPSCGRPMAGHVISYSHNTTRVTVTCDESPSRFGPPIDETTIFMWTYCKECNARTEIVPMSDATWCYSFAKYLEILCYNPHFVCRNVCEHIDQTGSIRRCFRKGAVMVHFDMDEVDLFEMRVPKIQVLPEHVVRASGMGFDGFTGGSGMLKPISTPTRLGSWPLVGASNGGGGSSNALGLLSSSVASNSSSEADTVTGSNVNGNTESSALTVSTSSSSTTPTITVPNEGPDTLPEAYPLVLEDDQILDQTRLEIMYFYGSLKDHIKSLQDSTGAADVAQNTCTPDQVRCQLMLDEMSRNVRDEEAELYNMLDELSERPEMVNNVRRCFVGKIKGNLEMVEGWEKSFITGSSKKIAITPKWEFPEYYKSKGCHIFPDSFVIVREDEPTSILAFTLSSREYRNEVIKLHYANNNNNGDSSSSTATTPSQSPNLSTASLNPTAAAAAAIASAQSAAETARWESQEEYRTKTKLFSHDPAPGNSKPHIRFKFAEGKSIFSCTVYYAEQFEYLRRRCEVSNHFILSMARCAQWNASGGKSRAVFFKTHDDRFVIKQLASNWTLVEKDALLKFAPAYFDYMANADKSPTVLAKIFGFYTIRQKNITTGVVSELDVLVMEHLFCNVKISR